MEVFDFFFCLACFLPCTYKTQFLRPALGHTRPRAQIRALCNSRDRTTNEEKYKRNDTKRAAIFSRRKPKVFVKHFCCVVRIFPSPRIPIQFEYRINNFRGTHAIIKHASKGELSSPSQGMKTTCTKLLFKA